MDVKDKDVSYFHKLSERWICGELLSPLLNEYDKVKTKMKQEQG